MRLSLILGLCIVLCGAVMVQASPLPCQNGTGAVANSFSYVDTPNADGSSLDEIDIYLTAEPTGVAAGNQMQLLEGTWSASGGALGANAGIALVQTVTTTGKGGTTYSDWRQFTGLTPSQSAGYAASYPSWVDFDTVNIPNGAAANFWNESLTGYTSPEGVPIASNFSGSWITTGATDKPVGAEVATFFVTHGAELDFAGHFGNPGGYYAGGFGFTNSITVGGGFSCNAATTPEPSTIILAASGLIGLLCYAWRKRR